jgi:hypothetical protein
VTDEQNNAMLDEIYKELDDDFMDYIYFWSKDKVCLDGDFTRRELEIIAKHMEYKEVNR